MDSVGRITSSMRHAAIDHGLHIPSDGAISNIIGLSLVVAMQKLHPEVSSDVHLSLVRSYSEYYKVKDTTPAPLFMGVESFLYQLIQNNHILAVATGKSRAGIERVLAETNLRTQFKAVRGADDTKSKPDPLMLEQILSELDFSIAEAVMVGDSIHDLQMAQNLGMDAIAVTWGVHSKPELEAFAPVFIATTIQELASYLNPSFIAAE